MPESNLKKPLLSLAVAALVLAGCATTPPPKPLNDGELALPADYKAWPKFLSAVQRANAKQVREIYMNKTGAAATAAAGFANGTAFVMENYAAKANADGTPVTGPDGKLVKGELQRVFVMGKGEGWGQAVAAPLRTGNWVYTSYLANGQKGPEDLITCRACHIPAANKDFVLRYDEHFAQRRAALPIPGVGQHAVVWPVPWSAGEAEQVALRSR